MKRIICLILALLMLVTLVACGGTNPPAETSGSDVQGENTPVDAAPYEGEFKVGFSRVVITPTEAQMKSAGYNRVDSDITATCVAFSDGKTTSLIYTIDTQNISQKYSDTVKARIKSVTKVAPENIFISAIHTHSSLYPDSNAAWATSVFLPKMTDAAKEAIADLSNATAVYLGEGKSTGMAWVRNYINADGTRSSVNPVNQSIKSVADADDTVLALRFVREDKKDVIIANWQCHPAHAISAMPTSISADFVHYVRSGVEAADEDALVAYFSGASGNLNLNPPNRSMRKYKDFIEVGKALANVVVDITKTDKMQKLELGNVKTTAEKYNAPMKKDSADVVAAAQKNFDAGKATKAEKYIVSRNKEENIKMYLGCVSFGDIAFISVPYEMFDNNGVQIREQSPFKTTFIMTNADGDHAYMPSREAWEEYGGYETEATLFGSGTAELLVEEYVRILKSHK